MKYDINNVSKAINGDKESFSQLYREIYPDLYKLCVYMCSNVDIAEDIVSETVIDAYKGINKLQKPESFDFWILKILSAKVKKFFKTKYNSFSANNPNASAIDDSYMADDNVNQVIEHHDLITAMKTLDRTERMIISLCIVDGYSSKAVGEILNMNPNTVRSKLNRSLSKLKSQKEVKGYDR